MALDIHTQGMFNDHKACSLDKILVMATRVMGLMKMGNTVPRMELELALFPMLITTHPWPYIYVYICIYTYIYIHKHIYMYVCTP